MTEKKKKKFYKRWWFWTLIILLVIGLINQPSEEEQAEIKAQQETKKKEVSDTKEPTEEVDKQNTDEETFKAYASNITGRAFVKDIALVDNKSEITFYLNFEEFKSENPDSALTIEDYTGYFETGEAIEKILVIENVRLLRQFPALEGAKMTLPYDNKMYSINIDRKSLNEYLGFKVEKLKVEDESWSEKFVNPIGYDEEKRKALFNEFGKVE